MQHSCISEWEKTVCCSQTRFNPLDFWFDLGYSITTPGIQIHEDYYFEKENLLNHFHSLTDCKNTLSHSLFSKRIENLKITVKEKLKITGIRFLKTSDVKVCIVLTIWFISHKINLRN